VQVAFKEGQMVNKGDFLAQIDPRPYQVALEQAQAQLAKDQALLKNAQLDLQRYNTLVAQNSIAKQTRDTQVSLVAQNEATVKADQAQIDAQKLNLTYCRIVSPVTGRVGLRQVDAGNYVQTSDPNGIVVVTQLQPISVIFTLPEDNLPEVMKRVRTGVVLPVTAYERTGSTELAKGKLDTVGNQLDTTTGTGAPAWPRPPSFGRVCGRGKYHTATATIAATTSSQTSRRPHERRGGCDTTPPGRAGRTNGSSTLTRPGGARISLR